MNIIDFWVECVKWAFWRWESVHSILVTITIIILGFLGIGGVAFAAMENQLMALMAVVPIVFMLLFVAPYKLWKKKADAVTELTTKRVEVEIEKHPEETGTTRWWHLIVRNPGNVPIESCYGQLLSFEPNRGNKPYQGIRLPWSSHVTREMERYTIPASAQGILDFIVTVPKYFSVVSFTWHEGKRAFFNYESPGTYEIILQIGSETESFPPTVIKVKVKYLENGELRIEKIEDSIPQGGRA